MRIYECKTCGNVCTVLGLPKMMPLLDDPKWSSGYPCVFDSKCAGPMRHEKRPTRDSTYTAELGAFYRALHGFGLSTTSVAEPGRVCDLLKNGKVVSVDAAPIGQPVRTIVNNIRFEDGTVLHFANSNEGACVYLIEESPNEDYRVVTDRDLEVSAEVRTQNRPPAEREQGASTNEISTTDEQPKRRSSNRKGSQVSKGTAHRLRDGSHGESRK